MSPTQAYASVFSSIKRRLRSIDRLAQRIKARKGSETYDLVHKKISCQLITRTITLDIRVIVLK